MQFRQREQIVSRVENRLRQSQSEVHEAELEKLGSLREKQIADKEELSYEIKIEQKKLRIYQKLALLDQCQALMLIADRSDSRPEIQWKPARHTKKTREMLADSQRNRDWEMNELQIELKSTTLTKDVTTDEREIVKIKNDNNSGDGDENEGEVLRTL